MTSLDGKVDVHSTVDLGQVAVRHKLRRLEANAQLETRRAPVHELDSSLGFEGGYSGMGVARDDVATVEQASSHILAIARVTLDHLVIGLEAGHGHFLDRVGLVSGLGCRDNRSVGDKREVDTRIRHQVGLELVQINVEGTIESKRSSDRRNN